MTRAEASRRYLQVHRNAHYTGLSDEHRQAHLDTLKGLEREHDRIKDHALAGSNADFDQPLNSSERGHQAWMRQQEGLTHSQVLALRKELRAGDQEATSTGGGGRGSRRSSRRSLKRAGGYASSAGDWATLPQTEGYGRMAFATVGWGVGLSLLFLLLTNAEKAPRGKSAIELVSNGIGNTIATLVSPLADPLSPSLRPAHR